MKASWYKARFRCLCFPAGPQVEEHAIFGGCKEYFAHISLNLPEKLLCDKRPRYKFILALVHYILLYHDAIDCKIKILVLEIWFLITQLNKVGYARLCKNIVASQLAQYYWAFASQFWSLAIHIPAVDVSKELRS